MSSETNYIEINECDDFHVHLRDGDVLSTTVPAVAESFRRAIVMPNLKPPVTTTEQAEQYRERILKALESHGGSRDKFTPLMTLYLTDDTPPEEIIKASKGGFIKACKLYPKGATTHSNAGVSLDNLKIPDHNLHSLFKQMQIHNIPLLIHGESPFEDVDIFDREVHFLTNYLPLILKQNPSLKIVIEHITTEKGASIVASLPSNVAATVTVQHLLLSRNALLAGGLRPHHYCMPLLKRESDRVGLLKYVTSDDEKIRKKFFAGTDSAPHPVTDKQACCGAAGCYTAHAAVEMYLEIFEGCGKLEYFSDFVNKNGAQFYELPLNQEKVRIVKSPWTVSESLKLGSLGATVVPLKAGQEIKWKLQSRTI